MALLCTFKNIFIFIFVIHLHNINIKVVLQIFSPKNNFLPFSSHAFAPLQRQPFTILYIVTHACYKYLMSLNVMLVLLLRAFSVLQTSINFLKRKIGFMPLLFLAFVSQIL